jgi:hypothetical protein
MEEAGKTKGDSMKEESPKSIDQRKRGELKTDYPLSEKDEIKKAEDKLRKATKKQGLKAS